MSPHPTRPPRLPDSAKATQRASSSRNGLRPPSQVAAATTRVAATAWGISQACLRTAASPTARGALCLGTASTSPPAARDPTSGAPSLLYFSAQGATKAKPGTNGIVTVAPADLDSDHIVDFIYAGDTQGNIWRWDVTGNQSSLWK